MKPLKSNERDIFLLDQYIKGQLSESQKSETEQRLLSDIDFRSDYEYLKKVAADIRIASLYETMQVLKDAEQEYGNNNTGLKNILKSGWKKYLIALIVVSGMIYMGVKYLGGNKNSYPEHYAEIFEARFDKELILHQTYRAVNQTVTLSAEQRRAYELYSIQKFDMAAPLLQKLWETKNDTLALYYWGISEIGRGNVEKGEMILKSKELVQYPNLFK